MQYFQLFSGIIIIVLIIIIICLIFYKKSYDNSYKEKLSRDIQLDLNRLESLNREIQQKELYSANIIKEKEKQFDNILQKYYNEKKEIFEREIADWSKSAQEAASYNSNKYINSLKQEMKEYAEALEELETEVADYRKKRDVINQDILRSRAVEEKENFYRVQLDESSISDIKLLNSIKKELIKTDLLDKLIYDNYISKPMNEMIKRVLEGNTYSGIYKITRLKTGEIYIGKSTDIKARWQGHAKTAFHCGTISHSTLHTIIEKDGITEFTWEMIEEVPKDKLSEREKYWINFYDSKRFGLNEKEGG